MTQQEAKEILRSYRAGTEDSSDPTFAEALNLTQSDPALGRWFVEETKRDAIIFEKLAGADSTPAGLKASVLATQPLRHRFSWTTGRALALAAMVAAVTFILSTFLTRPPASEKNPLAYYRGEMISFLNLSPALDLETTEIPRIQDWLKASSFSANVRIPNHTAALPPVGCRQLLYRGRPVALACFLRKDGQLVHLLAVDHSAFPDEALPRQATFEQEGAWMTATWVEGEIVYLLTTRGDRAKLERFL